MEKTDCSQQLTFWKMGKQEVTASFDGGRVVTDAGLLPMRKLDKELHVLSDLAARLPDPRDQRLITHSREALLTQQVYQILAGYPDCNDAQQLRNDPLLQTLVDRSPDDDQSLASGSTLARFPQAYTRREAGLPPEERPVLLERQAAMNERIRILNDYLVDLFIRTRRTPPASVTIDFDASDDPTHGEQILTGFHGYFEQHQYFPLFAFDGDSGFPLAAWLRPGTVHSSCGVVDALRAVVTKLRQAWPNVVIRLRGDGGFAMPELYEYVEGESILYAFGFTTNSVLKKRTDHQFADLKTYYYWYGRREPHVQHFEAIEDYQAEDWTRPRRMVYKLEISPQGTNRRFVVTNMSETARAIYKDFYVQRGDVPESPIGELKKGLQMDRLSFHHFRANAMKLLEHVMAYALVVLFREAAAAAEVHEVEKAEVTTLRQRLWKVGALADTSVRKIWFRLSETWPYRELWTRCCKAVEKFVAAFHARGVASAGQLPTPLLS
jgi:hypothetical protein